MASPEKVLLDADGLARTLSRIAHELIEANPDLSRVALVGIQTRGVPIAQRLRRLVEERAGAAPAISARSTSPSTATTFRFAEAARRCTHSPLSVRRRSTSRSKARRSSSSTTSSTPGRRSARRSRRSSTTAAPSASSSQCSSTEGTASCRSAPTTSARTCRRHATSASRCSSSRSTRSTASCSYPQPKRRAMTMLTSASCGRTSVRPRRRRGGTSSRSRTSRATTSSGCSRPHAPSNAAWSEK